MSALQTNINTLMSANSVDELKSRLVAILTTIAETPAGSGITAITSDDGSISINNTDPSAPDLSIGYKELSILYSSADGTDNGDAIILNPSSWYGTLTITRIDSQINIESNGTPFTLQKTFVQCNFVGDDTANGFFYNAGIDSNTTVAINVLSNALAPHTGALGNGTSLFCTIKIQVYP